MKALVFNLILPWNVLFLLQQSHHVDAVDTVEIGAQIEKYDADKFMLRERRKRVFQILPLAKLNANKTDLLLQQIENEKLLKESFEDALSQLDDIDFSTFPEFEGLRETIEYFRNETSKAMADIIEIFENLEKEQPTLEYGIIDSSNNKKRSQDERDDFFDKDTHESQQEKLRGFYKRARNSAEYHGYDHLYDLHDALGNGDHIFLEKMMSAFHRDMADATESSMDNKGRRKLSKIDQCKQLRKCAESMSLYDLFMFFYSDLVDKNTGDFNVDATIVRFDESNLSEKEKSIKSILKKMDDSTERHCDDLLEQFHKTIDNRGTPEWHGGTVDEVCLATNTADYVSLTGIMSGMRNLNTFYEKSTQGYLVEEIDRMVLEILDCSADLFFSDQNTNKDKEKFIFMDTLESRDEYKKYMRKMKALFKAYWKIDRLQKDRGTNKIQIPFDIDASSSGCEFVKLTDNLVKRSIKPRHTDDEAMSTESCKHLCCGKPWCHTFTCTSPYKGTKDDEKDLQMCKKCKLYEKDVASDSIIDSSYSGSEYLDSHYNDGVGDTYVMGKCTYEDLTDNYNNTGWNVGYTYSVKKTKKTKAECLKLLEDNEDYLSYDWYKYSGGICYLSTCIFKSNDVSRDYDYELKTCKIEPSKRVRQATGQLVGENVGAGYLLKSYGDLKTLYKTCVDKMIADDTKTTLKALECIKKLTKPVDDGLKLIFGSSPSPGFVCGLNKAITVDKKKMPGECCLDAPYQLKGDHWGHKPICQTNHICTHSAPFFANLSEEACSAYGGSYCANPDCSQLRICIEYFKVGKDQFGNELGKKPTETFKKYLNEAPLLTEENQHNKDACYETREYFGFQGHFIQDKKICRSIERFQHSKDFENLSKVMNMKKDDGNKGDPFGIGGLKLNPPTEEKSKSEVFQGEYEWAKKNHVLQHVIDGFNLVLDILDGFECPEDITGITQTVCGQVKNALFAPLRYGMWRAQMALDTSEFQRGVDAELGSIDFAQIWETTQAIYGNMKETGRYLKRMLESRDTLEGSTVVKGESGVAKQVKDLVQESMENMEISVKEEIHMVKKSMEKMENKMDNMVKMEYKMDKVENKMEKIERTLEVMTRMLENGAANKI